MGSSSISLPAWSCRPIGSLAGGIVPAKSTGPSTAGTWTAVSPHSRGANLRAPPRMPKGRGGPPLAWGKHFRLPGGGSLDRWTPTRVGQTPEARATRHPTRVDPHSRGANTGGQSHQTSNQGGPPLAWGKRPSLVIRDAGPRWTPTRVGQTAICWNTAPMERVDPHSRGANIVSLPP